jgi:uncharacterized protein (TIGR02145 family)
MKNTRLFSLIILLSLMFLFSCQDDEESIPPTATIGIIQDYMEILKGTPITFSVTAEDEDGTIRSVTVYIDGEGYDTANVAPYDFTWPTQDEANGAHEINATAVNTEGETGSHVITVNVVSGQPVVPCPEAITISYEGQTYNTVKIGDQCWLKENLNLDTENSRTYEDDPANGQSYGRLYNWEEANSACPPGWHLPTYDDWCTLVQHVDGSATCAQETEVGIDAGFKLKANNGWLDQQSGSDQFGFRAQPAGYFSDGGSFEELGRNGRFWSSTEASDGSGSFWSMNTKTTKIVNGKTAKGGLLSVRCIKD